MSKTEPSPHGAGTLLAAVAKAAELWRRAEKRHALMVLGELKGNSTLEAVAVERQLNCLRIASDRYQAATVENQAERTIPVVVRGLVEIRGDAAALDVVNQINAALHNFYNFFYSRQPRGSIHPTGIFLGHEEHALFKYWCEHLCGVGLRPATGEVSDSYRGVPVFKVMTKNVLAVA